MPDQSTESHEPTRAAAAAPFCDQDPLRGAKLQYPVSFELRIIHLASAADTLRTQISEIARTYGVAAGAPRPLPVSGQKYGRMAIQVTFADEAAMHGVYAAIGALPAVKAVM